MNIFNPYLNVIKKAVAKDPKRMTKLYSSIQDDFDMSYIQNLRNELPDLENLNESVRQFKGMNAPVLTSLPKLGSHPDFEMLRNTTNTENHWIISGFIDVKKSTQLFNRFNKATVALITEGIVKASIFAVNLNGGYVHRIQGDGLMVYFGGKNKDKSDATKDALKAFAMISYFVKNDLREYFEANGISEIFTRAGLDLGHDNQVLWMYSGLGDTGEITTCSLHTSLAPKMQANALSNGIVVGQHIINQMTNQKYFNKKAKPIWDYGDGRVYEHYDFDWERYIVENNFAIQNRDGKILLNIGSSQTKPNSVHLAPIAQLSKPYFNS
ncbi:MAG: hypothetical protein WC389_05525 [Lutibacter sp.]|jgi:hypothetical protein